MSQAEALLTSLTEDVHTHDHIVIDQDSYFVIDPDTREIETATRGKQVLMQNDHNSEKFTFELTRYIEGHDMTLCNRVRVHFINVDGETNEENADVAELYDLAVAPNDETKVLCTWTITRQATQLVGTLNFLVQYECIDDEGNSVYEWHTDIYTDVEVKRTINNAEQAIIEYSNVLEQWYQRIFGTGDAVLANITSEGEKQVAAVAEEGKAQVAAVAAEGDAQKSAIQLKGEETLATIPADYTEVYNMADEAIRTKADAIVLEVAGTTISMNDSSDDHILNLKMFGRTTQKTTTGAQLAYIPDVESYENNGITWSSNGGIVTAKGNAPIHSYTPSNIHADLTGLVGTFYLSGNGKYIKVAVQCTRDGVTNYINAPQEFTLDGTETRVELYCQITTYNTDINDVAYPMVNVGNAALPWESYTGGIPGPNPEYPQELASIENPTVTIYGKNLLKPKNSVWEYGGITYTTNIDGSVTVTGATKATEDSTCHIVTKDAPLILPKGRYTLSGCFGGSEKSYRILIYSTDWKYVTECTDGPVSFTLDEETSVFVYIWVYRGNTVNETLYPMICAADLDSDYYEKYVEPQSITLHHTLHGLPVTSGGNYIDENGQQWICDEVDFDRGVYVQRLLVNTITDFSKAGVVAPADGYTEGSLYLRINMAQQIGLCDKFVYMQSGVCDRFAVLLNGGLYFTIAGEYTADEWKTKMSELAPTVVLPLATPIETPLTEEEIAYYKKLKTNYHNTTVMNDRNVHMAIKYAADTLIYLRDNQPKPTDEQVQAAVNEYASQNGIQVPTDDHINTLIDNALGVIVNDEY